MVQTCADPDGDDGGEPDGEVEAEVGGEGGWEGPVVMTPGAHPLRQRLRKRWL